MLISNLINDSFGLLSKQLRFYCWHYKRDLDKRQQQELIDILNEQHFERLANKIKSLSASNIADCRQQIGKLLFVQCLASHRRHQLIQLIESDLVDIDVRLDNYGRTLLHRTLTNLDVELVKVLIDHGVNIYLRDYAGNTALHVAIQSYRNGGLIYNNESDVVQNLTRIIRLLLDTDHNLQTTNQSRNKKLKIEERNQCSHDIDRLRQDKFNEAGNESDSSDKNPSPDLERKNLVPEENKPIREHTICRMIDSQCMCKSEIFDPNRNKHQPKPTNDTSVAGNQESHKKVSARTQQHLSNNQICHFNSDDIMVSLVNAKNAFGRAPLHDCVLVVGEQYLDQIIKLLLLYGADPDIVDTRMKTPLYDLVKRPGVSAIKQKCHAIRHLIGSGCDDLGLALDSESDFNEETPKDINGNSDRVVHKQASDDKIEKIFTQMTYRRVPSLRHLSRLSLVRANNERNGKLGHQIRIRLPNEIPISLDTFVNRKLLDQTELL